MKYGFHLSIAGKQGVAGAAQEAELLGLGALQIFAKSPRSWKTRPLSPLETENFRARCQNLGGLPSVIHASYLINLGAEGELGEKSVFSLADDLSKARTLGVSYVVVHPSSGQPQRLQEAALRALELAGVGTQGPRLLLENTAGGGEKLGNRLESLGSLIQGTPLGVCFDTCHAFAAGYPVDTDVSGLQQQLADLIGWANIPVIHLNDSVGGLGSRIDHHAGLLQGQIGEALRDWVQSPLLQERVVILETPRSPENDAHNLRTLRDWLLQN